MIATNIDGSPVGGNALFDILAVVVSSPEVYAEKLKQLQESIDRNNEAIALAGKASEIVAIREGIAEEKAAAQGVLDRAVFDAQALVSASSAEAEQIVTAAQAEAAELRKDATAANRAAKAKLAAAHDAAAVLEAQQAALDVRINELDAAIAAANAEKAAANAAQDAVDELKADIISKHKAFLESLA
jgi:hypothetical protein